MNPLAATDSGSVREAQAEFVDLICADPELMRAEFDAIVEAGWGSGSPPPQPDQAGLTPRRSPERPATPEAPATSRHPKPGPPRSTGLTRLRSPPDHPSTHADEGPGRW